MAITTSICSSPNQPPILPTLSLPTIPFTPLKTHHPLQLHLPFPSSSSKSGGNLVSNDALAIAAAAEALVLARAAVEAAIDAVAVTEDIGEVWSCRESGNESGGLVARRKRRRKRRKGLEALDEEMKRDVEDGMEGARLESERFRVVEAQKHEPTSKQLAKAMGMKMRSIDKSHKKRSSGATGDLLSLLPALSRERIKLSRPHSGSYTVHSYFSQVVEGSIGLLRGAEKFDHEREWKLSTYVYWWIRQAIIRAIENKSRIIRLPGHVCGMMAKITKAQNSLNQRFQRLPSHDEIAEVIKVNASTVKLVCERSRPQFHWIEWQLFEEIIQGPEEMMPEKMLIRQLMKQEVEKLLKTLSDREANVLRFTLDSMERALSLLRR
ncbi:hypothetical protein Prudu_005217 [Prunus dulcis]|uniref:RNA polymerase sigma-70 region 2 domain-containing protein n=1 Tax=Prunus dulcis TaxID=3755 RepID=A0A4Y1QX34_PRUDU|nr:hypothetical protein Prudu_005217 [Prunus dulcis]